MTYTIKSIVRYIVRLLILWLVDALSLAGAIGLAPAPVLAGSELLALLEVLRDNGTITQAYDPARWAERLAGIPVEVVGTKHWSDYLLACMHFHANELDAAQSHFASAVRQPHILEPKGAIDALAGSQPLTPPCRSVPTCSHSLPPASRRS